MPGMTGTDVYAAIATDKPDLAAHFVLMSGDVLNPQLQEFAQAHGLRVLEKPFDIEMVTTVVHDERPSASLPEPASDSARPGQRS